ncbi:MAG: hypothetical protein WAP35_01260 [Solirubrobacterales bacterium]
MSESQKFHLRSAGFRRDIVAEVDTDAELVDRQSGTPFKVVGELLPIGKTDSDLPWAEQNLRVCGCTRQQLIQKDINDCPYCDRRIPAAGATSTTVANPVATPAPVTAAPETAAPETAAPEPTPEPATASDAAEPAPGDAA